MSTSLTFFFFFNDTATTEIYTLSLHDALPIYDPERWEEFKERYQAELEEAGKMGDLRDIAERAGEENVTLLFGAKDTDRKSTRLNSSHANISYAVFCLKKKKNKSAIDRQLMSK